ncbi:MAG: glycerophosphodiester phosphodiesterase family protein [Candidatus Nezhaarchaeales archaeon]
MGLSLFKVYGGTGLLVIAHRGASAYAPENTLRAVKLALELGVDAVEVDVRLSKDGYPMVIHDATLDRTTDGSGPVAEFTLAELRKLNAGFGEHVPTLQEVIEEVKGKARLIVEVKVEGAERKVVEALKEADYLDYAMVTSFIHLLVKRVKEIEPRVKTGVIISGLPVKLVDLALHVNADAIFPNHKYLSGEAVEEVHRQGLQVYPWVVDDVEEAKRLIGLGVDGLATNRPRELLRLLGRWPPQRIKRA